MSWLLSHRVEVVVAFKAPPMEGGYDDGDNCAEDARDFSKTLDLAEFVATIFKVTAQDKDPAEFAQVRLHKLKDAVLDANNNVVWHDPFL